MIGLIGLGNPGEEYAKNRHNVGMMFVDYFLQQTEAASSFKYDKYALAETAKCLFNEKEFILAKPQTFMNKSGESVNKLFITYKLKPEDLFVAHDDLDIPIGKFKINIATGPKLHNGLSSIEKMIGTPNFWRIRIGVENRGENRIPGEAYVLQNFTEEENKLLHQTFEQIFLRLKEMWR